MPNMDGVAGCSPFKVSNLGCNSYSAATQSLLDGLAHEFAEATTDPHIDAGWTRTARSSATSANFVYGSRVTLANETSWQIQEPVVERCRRLRPDAALACPPPPRRRHWEPWPPRCPT
jgi:hypothetical protein